MHHSRSDALERVDDLGGIRIEFIGRRRSAKSIKWHAIVLGAHEMGAAAASDILAMRPGR
jgi:hypothetical protein